jgi:hypothetical protein
MNMTSGCPNLVGHLLANAQVACVPLISERPQRRLDRLNRAHPQPKARTIGHIGGGDPPSIQLSQAHVDPKRRATEPEQDHGGGIADRPPGHLAD